MKKLLSAVITAVGLVAAAPVSAAAEFIVMQLKDGPVIIRLRPDIAPNHVALIKELAAQGF